MGNRNNPSIKQKKGTEDRKTSAAKSTSYEADAAADAVTHEKIAGLASTFWAARGFPEGSSEEEWHRAEEELMRQSARNARVSLEISAEWLSRIGRMVYSGG